MDNGQALQPMNVTLLEHNHLAEMHASLKRKLIEAQRKDEARMDSVCRSILSGVVTENYDRAKEELTTYVEMKTNFPNFQERARRYVQHCCELIQTIQTKRNFPGLATLSLAKQQEVHEKVLEHFEDLKRNLKLLVRVEREHKLEDLRSTVWVVQAVVQAVALVVIAFFIVDLRDGMFTSLIKVIEHGVGDMSAWLVNLFD